MLLYWTLSITAKVFQLFITFTMVFKREIPKMFTAETLFLYNQWNNCIVKRVKIYERQLGNTFRWMWYKALSTLLRIFRIISITKITWKLFYKRRKKLDQNKYEIEIRRKGCYFKR